MDSETSIPDNGPQKHNKNIPQGRRKYYLDRSELRLPPPVLCMSDFERHAQRKNRAIQVTYDDELQKIGIYSKVVNKLLTSDVRQFCLRFSQSKRQLLLLRHEKAQEQFPEVQRNKSEITNIQDGGQSTIKPDELTFDMKDSLAIPPIVNVPTTGNSKGKPPSSVKDSTNSKANSTGIISSREKRFLPQSAKLRRVKDDVTYEPRPKSTSSARHVTFWDMVDEPKANRNLTSSQEVKYDPFNQSAIRLQDSTSIKSFNGSAGQSDIRFPRNKKIGWSSPVQNQTITTENSSKSLTSFLHFDKNRACVDLKRELRTSAANRKGTVRRRRLSELLTTEKNCYEESLNKMATRLRDEKLLKFCKESCRGMDNVFEYNL